MSGTPEGPGPVPASVRPPVTERQAVGRTAAELSDYRAAFNTARLGMAVVDSEGLVVTANDALGGLLGAEPAGLNRQTAADLVDLATDARTWHAYREVLRGRRSSFRCTRRLKHADGHSLWAEVSVAPVPDSSQVLLSVADVSDRRELQAKLRHLQMHDPVTRLPNRALFFERLSAALDLSAYGHGSTARIGLCYLDLDGFKAVNDTLGHRFGDRLLAVVASRLTHCADQPGYGRSGGHLVARLGGDEFALLVEDSSGTEHLADLAGSVLAALQEPFDLGGQRLSVSASIGVVERPHGGHQRHRADAGRRHHAVLGEGGRQGPLDTVRPGAQRAPDDPPGALVETAARCRGRRVRAGVPAAGGSGGRRAQGRGGAGPLGPSAVRAADAQPVHRAGGGGRLDRPARRVGAAYGLAGRPNSGSSTTRARPRCS